MLTLNIRSRIRPIFRYAPGTLLIATLLVVAGSASAKGNWTHFEMNKHDGNNNYLWQYPENWSAGLPNAEFSVEIGDDTSGKALHCVIRKDAVCQSMELAEHGRTEGTTLRLEKGVTLTFMKGAVMSKDRESTFYIDGTARAVAPKTTFRVGGPWGRPEANLPSCSHVIISATGTLEAWFVSINTDRRAEKNPSSPWGPKYWSRATDSEVVVKDGRLIVQAGLRISTSDPKRPGHLKLSGKATFKMKPDAGYGVQVWAGVWEIDGGEADIHVGKMEFWGDKFKEATNKAGKVYGPGQAVLKLTGKGVSTIHAGELNFISAALVDVSGLEVPAGTYKVIDGKSLGKKNLQLAPGTPAGVWELKFDDKEGDVLLIRKVGPARRTTRPSIKAPPAGKTKGLLKSN